MDSIYHEKQDGALCAQHCLNSLLQSSYFTAVDLADIATQLDQEEQQYLSNNPSPAPTLSSNMDDTGFFSVQVISRALSAFSLSLLPIDSQHPDAVRARRNPQLCKAFVCNYKLHWLTVRKLGNQWFNLNSLLKRPVLLSDTYISLFLTQLSHEGYSVYVVQGTLPLSEADTALILHPASFSAQQSHHSSKPKDGITFSSEEEAVQTAIALSLSDPNDNESIRDFGLGEMSTHGHSCIGVREFSSDEEALKTAIALSLTDPYDGSNQDSAQRDVSSHNISLCNSPHNLDSHSSGPSSSSELTREQLRQKRLKRFDVT